MRRADRLFRIIQFLRHRRITTARALAQELEVSVRTIYRDMDDLSASGIPLLSEPGKGYRLLDGFDLPPLMFDRDELTALLLGARMVQTWSDPVMAKAARGLVEKVESVIPDTLKDELGRADMTPLRFEPASRERQNLASLRQLIRGRRKVRLGYIRLDGETSRRLVRPLGLFFWGKVWTLAAWCELRSSFRSFRVDRIGEIVAETVFDDEPGRTLQDYIDVAGREGCHGHD